MGSAALPDTTLPSALTTRVLDSRLLTNLADVCTKAMPASESSCTTMGNMTQDDV